MSNSALLFETLKKDGNPLIKSLINHDLCQNLLRGSFKSWIMRIIGFSKATKRVKNNRQEIVDLFVQMQNSFFYIDLLLFWKKDSSANYYSSGNTPFTS